MVDVSWAGSSGEQNRLEKNGKIDEGYYGRSRGIRTFLIPIYFPFESHARCGVNYTSRLVVLREYLAGMQCMRCRRYGNSTFQSLVCFSGVRFSGESVVFHLRGNC